MTLETLLVFAKATGRTVVLPPRAPIYLLKGGNESSPDEAPPKLLSALDFFSEGVARLKRDGVLNVISFPEFVAAEGRPGGLVHAAAARVARGGSAATAGDVVELLLSWNAAAERGEQGARKKVRAWLRSAACAPRTGEAVVGGGGGEEEEEEALAAQARCPRWEPLQEALVFGRASDATLASWPRNPGPRPGTASPATTF